MSRRPPATNKRRCSFVREDGSTCQAWALRDSPDEAPVCYRHSVGPEERRARARRAAQAAAVKRRGNVEVAPKLSGIDPHVTLDDVLPIVSEALAAELPYVREPDWNARLAAVGTLLMAFPRYLRSTPEETRALLEQAIPEKLLSPEMLDTARVYRELRKSWDELDGLRWSKLKGLYVAPYPAQMIAPWENATKIQSSRPQPIPPDEAPVSTLPDGRPVLDRPGALPVFLEEPAGRRAGALVGAGVGSGPVRDRSRSSTRVHR